VLKKEINNINVDEELMPSSGENINGKD